MRQNLHKISKKKQKLAKLALAKVKPEKNRIQLKVVQNDLEKNNHENFKKITRKSPTAKKVLQRMKSHVFSRNEIKSIKPKVKFDRMRNSVISEVY